MNKEEFIKYIESLGFEDIGIGLYGYKEFRIHIWRFDYTFYDGSKWSEHNYNELTQGLLKLIRSIKLKHLLE